MATEKPTEKTKEETKKFAEGVCFKKLFFIFIIGSIFGCYYEMILNLVTHFVGDGSIFWETRTGVLYGPFSVIYGFGAVLMVYLLTRRKFTWWQIILLGGLIGGIFELLMGLGQEIFTGTSSWDYSDHWLNIAGKTSPFVMLIWGLICLLLMKTIYPACSNLIEKIPEKVGNIIFWVFLIFLSVDCFLSLSAVLRMNFRHHNVPTFTPYGRFLDTVYPDERVHRSYPNMIPVEEKP